MPRIETDYLIIGAGAVGLAFADTLLDETDADITLVDRHGLPGGHWNDAYPFVTLHQPSAFYGVNSMPLGTLRKDSHGSNQGFYELASGAEVSAYFQQVVQRRLLPSGRVRYHPMCEYEPDGGTARFRSLLSGEVTEVIVRRRIVDATYYGTTVPSTHRPKYAVAEGVRLVPPNALPKLWQDPAGRPGQVAILGAGKTAMDAAIWLLESGLPAERIRWVVPRDAWLLNRRTTQPGMEFFDEAIGGQVLLMESLVAAQTVDELFDRLEAGGLMLRIDTTRRPQMFHYATVAEGEVQILRRITDILRHGHVKALEPDAMVFADARVPVAEGTLFVDCTATAVERRPLVPVFQPDRIVLQMVRIPQPAFSAALVAWVEAHGGDDAARNALCAPIPLTDNLQSYPRATLVGLMNQFRWGQDPALRLWIRNSRLDGFGKLIEAVDPSDSARMALLGRMKVAGKGLMAAAPRWMAMAG